MPPAAVERAAAAAAALLCACATAAAHMPRAGVGQWTWHAGPSTASASVPAQLALVPAPAGGRGLGLDSSSSSRSPLAAVGGQPEARCCSQSWQADGALYLFGGPLGCQCAPRFFFFSGWAAWQQTPWPVPVNPVLPFPSLPTGKKCPCSTKNTSRDTRNELASAVCRRLFDAVPRRHVAPGPAAHANANANTWSSLGARRGWRRQPERRRQLKCTFGPQLRGQPGRTQIPRAHPDALSPASHIHAAGVLAWRARLLKWPGGTTVSSVSKLKRWPRLLRG